MTTKYYFKDFGTGRLRYTRGKFVGWQRGGILNCWGAIFMRKSDVIFIPHYLLTRETLDALPSLEEHREKLRGENEKKQ